MRRLSNSALDLSGRAEIGRGGAGGRMRRGRQVSASVFGGRER
jgi:hypothetical protein